MSITIPEFWKLTIDSELLTPDEASKLSQSFSEKHNGSARVDDLVKFLTGVKLSAYQAKILLAGRPGPFVYGDYLIYERIESGRMAGIFRAVHRGTMHKVCLFFLSGAAAQDAELLAHLHLQAAGGYRASVGHPNLMRCYHLVDTGAYKFIVLEDIEGKRVERQISTQGKMPVNEVCRIVRQAALGLGRMHAMGQVHGEVRPAHVWIEPDNNVKLLTFPLIYDPLVAEVPLEAQVGLPGKIPPKADYTAPELFDGQQPADVRSDIYSLGCTMYHMLAGRPPYGGADLREKLDRHRGENPRPLHDANSQVPQGLSKVVQYMLAKDPEMRYQQVNSVVEAILPFIAAADLQSAMTPPTAREQAYEAWLKRLAASMPAATSAPAAPAAAPAAVATPAKATPAPIDAAPVRAAIAAAQAAPVMAAQVAGAQPTGAPRGAVPQAVMATAVATPGGAAPMAVPIGSMPVAAAQAVNAAPMQAAPMMQQAVPLQAAPMQAMPAGGAIPYVGPSVGVLPGQAQPAAAPGYGDSGRMPSGPTRYARRRRSKMPQVIGLALVVGVGIGLWKAGMLDKFIKPSAATNNTAGTSTPAKTEPAKTAGTEMASATATPEPPTIPTAPEDSREKIFALKEPVWESPTKGPAIEAKYLAPGAQAVISIRLAALLKHPEGEKLTDGGVTGGLGTWLRETLPKSVGLTGDKIEQVVISLLDNGAAPPKAAYWVRTTEPVASEALVAAWGNPAEKMDGDKKFYTKDGVAYYVPASGEQRQYFIGPDPEVIDVIKMDGASPLPLELELMLKQTDSTRTVSIAFVPRVMLANGKPVFPGPAHLLREPTETFFLAADGSGELPKAVLLSLNLGDAMFAELRIHDPTAGPQNDAPAAVVESRIKAFPRQMRGYLLSFPLSTYSRPVLQNFEDMLRTLETNARVGLAEKEVVARAYLPAVALHNIAMSSYLALIDNPASGYVDGAGGSSGGGEMKPAATLIAAGAEGKLKKMTSLAFERNTLEMSIVMLSDDIGVPMTIRGTELQIEGITKNQSFALAEENKPAVEILKTIMMKASPANKLVYVIVKNDAGEEEIYITTRVAAANNKWKIPADLELKK